MLDDSIITSEENGWYDYRVEPEMVIVEVIKKIGSVKNNLGATNFEAALAITGIVESVGLIYPNGVRLT
tara:strand:- start:197 stop:403 length:207 start_codon:yes stop_codon:yes gene_type:complete